MKQFFRVMKIFSSSPKFLKYMLKFIISKLNLLFLKFYKRNWNCIHQMILELKWQKTTAIFVQIPR